MVISQEIHQSSVTKINMKITHLKYHQNIPGANGLIHCGLVTPFFFYINLGFDWSNKYNAACCVTKQTLYLNQCWSLRWDQFHRRHQRPLVSLKAILFKLLQIPPITNEFILLEGDRTLLTLDYVYPRICVSNEYVNFRVRLEGATSRLWWMEMQRARLQQNRIKDAKRRYKT